MTKPQKLKKLEARLESQMPLIGRCLRQRTAQALARDGSPDAVRILAKAIACSDDRKVSAIALDALRQIKKQQCIDEVCAVWAVTRHKDLANLLIKKSWVASAPVDVKVLSALKVGQLEVITKGGKEVVEPLIKALSDTEHEIVHRAELCITALENPDAVDCLCERWLQTRNKQLEQAIVQKGYVARKPINVRVLSALKTGQRSLVMEAGAEIVEPLLSAFSDKDPEIVSSYKQCAIALKKLEAQERLCRLVIEQDHRIARQVAITAQYAPRDPNQRALFYFLTEQWDKYESLDYEHTLLQTAYQVGDEQLRQRIAQKVRQAGRAEWVKILVGGHQGKRLGEMSDAEWETALRVLNIGRKWEEMWQLAQAAPPIWSVRLLRQLKDGEWVPKKEFAELVQMGQKCVADVLTQMNSSWRCQATLHGFSHEVSCLAISPDNKLLTRGSDASNTIQLWSLPDGKLLQTLTGHNGQVWQLAISPDGKLLASGGTDKTVRLWSLPDGKLLQTLTGHSDCIWSLGISPDSKLLASGSWDKTIQLWNLPDGKLLQTLTGHNNKVYCLSFSPNGKLLASGSGDKTIRLWTWGLYNLSRLPVEQMSAEDMQSVQEALQDKAISKVERDWLEFIQALVSWRRRFDVEVEEAPQRIDVGEFDIEIEG